MTKDQLFNGLPTSNDHTYGFGKTKKHTIFIAYN
jgi:hypothetical protein